MPPLSARPAVGPSMSISSWKMPMTSMQSWTPSGTQSLLGQLWTAQGTGAVRAFYSEFFRGFPGLRFDIKSLHVGEEAMPMEMVLSGMHTGPWFGIPTTGRRFEMPACVDFIFDKHDTFAGERGDFRLGPHAASAWSVAAHRITLNWSGPVL